MSRRRAGSRVLSAVQLAEFCDVDLKTIHNWCARGKIAHTRTAGRHLRFRRLDVVDFMRAYELTLPEALRQGRPRVALVERDAHALEALQRGLSRSFEVVVCDDAVGALLGLKAADPDVVVLGDVSPLDAAAVAARIRGAEGTRHVRVVTLGAAAAGAAASVPRGDVAALRDALAELTGLQ
jgi:excisionase family DNA binding protein